MSNIRKEMQRVFQAASETLRCMGCKKIGEKLFAISCGHLFCPDCLKHHSLTNSTNNATVLCPLCFISVDPNKTCTDELFHRLDEANVQFEKVITGLKVVNDTINDHSSLATKDKLSVLLERENIDPNKEIDIANSNVESIDEKELELSRTVVDLSPRERVELAKKEFIDAEQQTEPPLAPITVKQNCSVETQTDEYLTATLANSSSKKHECCIEKNLKRILQLNICESFNAVISALLSSKETLEPSVDSIKKLELPQVAVPYQDVCQVKAFQISEAESRKTGEESFINHSEANDTEMIDGTRSNSILVESVSNAVQTKSTTSIRKCSYVINTEGQNTLPHSTGNLEMDEKGRNIKINNHTKIDYSFSSKLRLSSKCTRAKQKLILSDTEEEDEDKSTKELNPKNKINITHKSMKKEEEKSLQTESKKHEDLLHSPFTRNKRKLILNDFEESEGEISSNEEKTKISGVKSKEVNIEEKIDEKSDEAIASQVAMRTRAKRVKHWSAVEPASSSRTFIHNVSSPLQTKKSATSKPRKSAEETKQSVEGISNVSSEKLIEHLISNKISDDNKSSSSIVQNDVFEGPQEETNPPKKLTRGRTKKVLGVMNQDKSTLCSSQSRCKETETNVGEKLAKKMNTTMKRNRPMSHIIDDDQKGDKAMMDASKNTKTRTRRKLNEFSRSQFESDNYGDKQEKTGNKFIAIPSLPVNLKHLPETDSPRQSDSSSSSGMSRSSSRAHTISSDKPKFVIMCSGLDGPQKRKVEKVAQLLNFNVVNVWTSSVTHLIVDLAKDTLKKEMLTTRSVKYLQTLLANKWIVSIDWITACANSNRMVDEAKYEIRGVRKGIKNDCPQQSRVEKIQFFQKYAVHFKGTFESFPIPISEVKPLVTIGNGLLVENEDELDNLSKDHKAIIVTEFLGSETQDSFKYVSINTFLDAITNLERL